MPVFKSDSSYYSLDGDPNNDLRYGSVKAFDPPDSLAVPSWYGLHGVYPGNTGVPPTSGVTIDGKTVSYAKLFATQPWVYTCVMRLLTWAIRVPLKAYVRVGEDSRERLRPEDHPLAWALAHPWQGGAAAHLTMNLLGPLLVHGNSTVSVELSGDSIKFKPRDWRFMNVLRFKDEPSVIRGWETDEDGSVETLSKDEVLHTAYWNPLGPTGLSPMASLGCTLATEHAAQRYGTANLSNMARPDSAITVAEQWLDLEREKRDEVIAQIRTQIESLYAGPDNAGKTAILPAGLSWSTIGSHTSQEAELIDIRKVSRNEIAAAYMIPPPMIGMLDEATYSNITTQREMAYTDGLAPPLVLIEQVLNAQLVHGMLGQDDIFVEHDFSGILRGDRLKEIEALREAIGTGLLSVNEGRRVLNYPSSNEDHADALWLPQNNLAPIGDTQTDTQLAVEADPAP